MKMGENLCLNCESTSMIIKQCHDCAEKGKNFYCNSCDKIAESFDIYSYHTNRMSENSLIGRVKAYTWHDVLEYIKNNFFYDLSGELNIDCEKDFAYIEKKLSEKVSTNISNDKQSVGYKIFLNKDDSTPLGTTTNSVDFWDLTD
jgi:hypothetical protein